MPLGWLHTVAFSVSPKDTRRMVQLQHACIIGLHRSVVSRRYIKDVHTQLSHKYASVWTGRSVDREEQESANWLLQLCTAKPTKTFKTPALARSRTCAKGTLGNNYLGMANTSRGPKCNPGSPLIPTPRPDPFPLVGKRHFIQNDQCSNLYTSRHHQQSDLLRLLA